MRPQIPEHALVTLLRQCFAKPVCQVRYQQLGPLPSRRHSPPLSSIIQRQRAFHTDNGLSNDLQTSFSMIEFLGTAENTLKLRALKPAPASTSSSSPRPPQSSTRIAVLGGGISGL